MPTFRASFVFFRPGRHVRRRRGIAAAVAVVLLAAGAPVFAPATAYAGQPLTSTAVATVTAAAGVVAEPGGVAEQPAADGELLSRRTATSKTFVDGRLLRTQLFAEPVHFQDDDGRWQQTDPALVEDAAGGYRNRAGAHRAGVPATADGEVRFTAGAEWVAYRLRGAAASPVSVTGSTASYAGVWPEVDLLLQSRAAELKETLRLKSSSAPVSYSYDVRVSDGLSPKAGRAGELWFVRADGSVALRFARPFAVDSHPGEPAHAPALKYTVQPVTGGFTVSVSLDRAWLSAPERVFPVLLDPSATNTRSNPDTYLSAGSPTTPHDTSPTLSIAGGVSPQRALLKFDTSAVPRDAEVLSAVVQAESLTTVTASVGLYAMTRNWDSAATWTTVDGTNLWATPGGEAEGTAQWQRESHTLGSRSKWFVDKLAKAWVQGSRANFGVMLRLADETGTAALELKSAETTSPPMLTVVWNERTGVASRFTFDPQRISENHVLRVNVANGNAVLTADGFDLRGVGVDLSVSAAYNSMGSAANVSSVPLPTRWSMNAGPDVSIDGYTDGKLYNGPDGQRWWFSFKDDLKAPPGLNARLEPLAGGEFNIVYNKPHLTYHFNSGGLLDRVRDTNGQGVDYGYDTSRRIVSAAVVGVSGRSVSYAYNTDGKLASVTDATGRVWSYGYTSGALTSLTDPLGQVHSYGYDANGRLARVSDPRGNATKIGYDSRGRVLSVVRVTDTAADTGPTTTFTYASGNTTVRAPNAQPSGPVTSYDWNLNSLVTKVTDQTGRARNRTFSPNLDVTTDDFGVAGSSSQAAYDPATNNLTSTTLPTGGSQSFTYDSAASGARTFLPADSTDPQGNRTAFTYNDAGQVKTATDSTAGGTGAKTRKDYQGEPDLSTADTADTVDCGGKKGQLCRSFDGRDIVTSYRYDARGDLVGLTPPAPLVAQSMSYDSLGRIASLTDGRGQLTTFDYDVLDRTTKVTYADGATVTSAFDAAGNLTSQTDRAGTTSYRYDRRNLVDGKTLPDGVVVDLTYDSTGNLSSYSDPGGRIGYAYDAANRPTEVTEPGGDCLVTPKVKCIQFNYDTAGRRDAVKYPNKVTQTYGYDVASRLTSLLANDDTGGLLTKHTYTYNKPNATTTTSDDDTTLRQSVTDFTGSADSTGVTTTYTHDSLNRLTRAGAWLARLDADEPVAHWRFGEQPGTTTLDDRRGPRDATLSGTSATLGRSGAVAGDTDSAVRFAGGSSANVLDDPALRLNGPFTLNLSARLLSQVGSFPGLLGKGASHLSAADGGGYELYYKSDGSVHFKKNNLDGLSLPAGTLTAGGPYRMITISYDGTTARVYVDGVQKHSRTVDYGTATETKPLTLGKYNTGDHDLDEVAIWNSTLSPTAIARLAWARDAGATYTYDNSGNRTSNRDTLSRDRDITDGKYDYTVNNANQLTARDGDSSLFGYDGNGNQTTAPALGGGGTLTTAFNPTDQASSFTTGGTTITNTYAGTTQAERTVTDGLTLINSPLGINGQRSGGTGTGTYFTRGPDGELLSIRTGTANASSDIRYYLYDGLGSITALTSSTGAIINRYRYDPYGNTLQATETVPQPFRYTGGYHDTKTGLLKLGIRYYNPQLGRFTQQDPTGQDPHYTYAGNNPCNFIDPSGANCVTASISDILAGTLIGAAQGFFFGGPTGATVYAAIGAIKGAVAGCGQYYVVGFVEDQLGTGAAQALEAALALGTLKGLLREREGILNLVRAVA